MLHKPKCENIDITTFRTSPKTNIYWKKHFHKNPLYFRIYADFAADIEKYNSSIGNKTTNIYKQNPVLNGFHVESELEHVLQSTFYKYPLGYNNVDWFVDEVIKLEKNWLSFLKTLRKISLLQRKMRKIIEIIIFVDFVKKIISDKVRNQCHLTGKYRGPAHSECNINVTQKQSNFIPFTFPKFNNYDCLMFFKKLVDKKTDKVNFDILPNTNEEYISVTYGCIRFIDSFRFLSSSSNSLVISLVDNNHKALKEFNKEIVDNDEILNIVNEIGEEDKTIEDLKKDYPNEIEKLEEALLD